MQFSDKKSRGALSRVLSKGLLCGLMALPLLAVPSARAAVDKAVYYDTTVGFSWQNATAAQVVNDYLVGKGYASVDASGLADFMTKHAKDGATSVVVFATDLTPDTIADPNANTDATAAAGSLVNQYLNAGGKLIYMADWPAYYLMSADGTNKTTWNDTGAASLWGFYPADWSHNDVGKPVIFTDEGKAWGFTKTWNSLRADDVNTQAFGLILGTVTGRPDAAMPWVKMYIGRPGSGFTYIYDHSTTATEFGDDELSQIQRVAEYFPSGEVTPDATVNVTLKNADGTVAAGQYVRLVGTHISLSNKTDDTGKATFKTIAGTYSLSLAGVLPSDPTSGSVTVAAGASQDVTLTKPAVADISTAGGVTWELKVPATSDGSMPTDDPASVPTMTGFSAYTVPSDWSTTNTDANIYAWIRAKVTVPDTLVGKDVDFGGFNVDDQDWTYWNGELVGHTTAYGTIRHYTIPASLVKKTNDVVILNFQGTGGAGISTSGPVLTQVRAGGWITGQINDSSGKAASGITVSASGTGTFGSQTVTNVTDAKGVFYLNGLGEGSYTVTVTPGASASGIKMASVTPVTATVKAGLATTVPTIALNAIYIPALPKIAAADKGVYFDDAYPTNWVNADSAGALRDYFVSAGYKELNAADFATFLTAHVTSKTPSVVVMAKDITPDTVVDISSGGATAKNLVNDYMDNGGRIIQLGDWPFYNIGKKDGTSLNLAGSGATTILGFAGSSYSTTDTAVLTTVGKAIGLTSTWNSMRAVDPNSVDVSLWMDSAASYAPGWIKMEPDSNGTGFFARILDSTDAPDATVMADAQLIAELSGSIPGVGPATTTSTVKLGDINADGKINVSDATLSLRIAVGLLTPTADQKTADDVNKDGKQSVADTTLILQVAVGVKTGF